MWELTEKYDDTLSSIPSTEPTSYIAKRITPSGNSYAEFYGADAKQLAEEFITAQLAQLRKEKEAQK